MVKFKNEVDKWKEKYEAMENQLDAEVDGSEYIKRFNTTCADQNRYMLELRVFNLRTFT